MVTQIRVVIAKGTNTPIRNADKDVLYATDGAAKNDVRFYWVPSDQSGHVEPAKFIALPLNGWATANDGFKTPGVATVLELYS